MAAASGPVETSSGKTKELNTFIPPEPPRPRQVSSNNGEDDKNEIKLPESNASLGEEKKTESATAQTTSATATSTPSSSGNESGTVSSSSEQKKRTPVLSPAEMLKQIQVFVPYKEPIWGGLPPESEQYSFDVLKNGTVVDSVELGKKPWLVFGRLPSCDVCLEHPSLSRHHAVVQYREAEEGSKEGGEEGGEERGEERGKERGEECGKERGWYLYDLDSTHGTWVNKVKIKPQVYRRLHVGHVVKFGGSSRLFILQGPERDREPECELSVSELKQQTARLKRENEVLKQAEMEEEGERERQRLKIQELRGCSWGMGEDAIEEEEDAPPTLTGLTPQHEHLYRDDPKKALKGFYEREGCDLPDYQFAEAGLGKHKCIVELPVDGPNGEVLVAEAVVSGKKKDAVVACALEACRLLDMHDMLHASKHESRKRKSRNWADDDFYDSDEDTFLDRTGTIEKKRIFRMKKCGKEEQAETYESLVPKHEEVQKRIAEIEGRLEQAKADAACSVVGEEEDALEAYMRGIRQGGMDTSTRLALKRELLDLRTQEHRLRRLVNLARPTHLPPLLQRDSKGKVGAGRSGVTSATRKIGTVKGPSKPCPPPVARPVHLMEEGFQEEEEEEDEESGAAVTPSSAVSASGLDVHSSGLPSLPEMGRPHKPSPGSHTQQKSSPGSETVEKRGSERAQEAGTASKTADKGSAAPQIVQKGSAVPQTSEAGDGRKAQSSVLSSIQALAASKTAGSDSAATEDVQRAGKCPMRGPTLPPPAQSLPLTAQKKPVKSTPVASSLQAFIEPPVKRKKKGAAPQTKKSDYDDSDPDYAMWMPPQGQSGDGRTSLNDKLGY